MYIIKHRKIFFIISGLLVLLSAISVSVYGLKLGADFTGGTIYEIAYTGPRPNVEAIRATLAPLQIAGLTVQTVGDQGAIIRSKPITEEEHALVASALSASSTIAFTEKSYSSIGPTVGAEMAQKGIIALALAVLFIIIFIALAFREVSRPVSSWKYGLMAIVALIHDVVITTGVFSVLGHFYGTEVDGLFLTALLTIFALSVNDTIVIFDRIRENIKNKVSPDFEETVGLSLSETIVRSLNTSLAVIVMLFCLYFFGGSSTKNFSLALLVGMTAGTYSSIFIAAPLLVVWNNRQNKKAKQA